MKKSIKFSDRSPCGYRCGINYHRPYIFNDQSEIALTDKQVLMLSNDITASKYLCQMILNQNDKISKDNEEKIEVLQRLKTNYEELEKEIVNDYQLEQT